ncbi:MAG: hypothetical protein WBM13_09410 [Bacteroidia bacterium]
MADVSGTNGNKYYQAFDVNKQLLKNNAWQQLETQFVINTTIEDSDVLKIYFWNKGHETICYDDIEFDIY